MSGSQRLFLRFSPLFFQVRKQFCKLGQFARQDLDLVLLVLDGRFQIVGQLHDVAQLALERKRAFLALLASGDGHVVEALAGGRKEVGVRVLERQVAGDDGIRRDVAVAKFGQHHFQRPPKTVEHADAVLERYQFFRPR